MTRRRDYAIRGPVWVAAGLIAGAIVAIGLTVWGFRADAIDDAANDVNNIAAILAEQTARSVESIHATLLDLQQRVATFGPTGSEKSHGMLASRQTHELLKARAAQMPHVAVITLADARGQVVSSSQQWPAEGVNNSDREFFQFLKTHPTEDFYVSAPVASRVTGAPTVFFVRRLGAPGEFAGLAVIAVELAYFRHVYESLTLLRHKSFLLVRQDGTILVRYPEAEYGFAQAIPASSPWHQVVRQGGGSYQTRGLADGIIRLITVRPLPGYPLVVNVGVTKAAALTTWERRATLIGIGTLLAVCCSALLLYQLARQFRHLLRSEFSVADREVKVAQKSRELEQVNASLDVALNNMSQGLCLFDESERLVICNDKYLRMYGLSAEKVQRGCTVRQLLELRQSAGNFSDDIDQYLAGLRTRLARRDSEHVTTYLKDGRVIAVHNSPTNRGGWVATHDDITERMRAEARIAHIARHDVLTDIANRLLFKERMDEALRRLSDSGARFSIFVFDLDLFKAVNDSLGHPVGDALLRAIAQRLQASTRDVDTVGRLGGDEFAILQVVQGNQWDEAVRLANRLMEDITAPYEIEGNRIVIGISIGIALAPEHGTEADQLLKNADLALYRAKADGRNSYRIFEQSMDAEVRLRRALQIDLRNAVARNEFVLHYQTIVDLAARKTCAVEALVRWRHPEYGIILPDRFIPLAEEIGMIHPLGEWIARQACTDAGLWPEHLKLAVNLSPLQFRTGKLINVVTDALAASRLAPARLELEITESVLLHENAGNLGILHQLKRLGLSVVLDDFGTGYSSLSYLRLFPFDKIKIDKSFVSELPTRDDCGAIVCAITGLARSLSIGTTAEGVETPEQLGLLCVAGCTQAQGYLFSRPRPVHQLDFAVDPSLTFDAHAA
jgi:diguanylate cyclase (GGDEF)-like protein/PAS domain S-box-containing protein